MPAWGQQPHQIGSLALNQGGGGAKLIARRWYTAVGTVNDTIPAGATWMSARTQGAGGHAFNDASGGGGGGGGGFSREDRSCTPGQAITTIVRSGGGGNSLTQVLVGDTLICAAAGGTNGNAGGAGGSANLGTGTIRRSGGAAGAPGQNGGPAGATGGIYVGGGAAGERDLADCLLPGGQGGDNATNSAPQGYGAGAGVSGLQNTPSFGGYGVAVIEYWSAKP